MITHKIVLAEDDEILAKVVVEELRESGFEVEHADNGNKALELIQSKRPDLALLDLLMPEKHGFDVLKELKKSPATKDVPVIIMTMLGRDEDIKKGLQLGAEDYIVKSQHAVGEIIDKIKEFFAKESHPGKEYSGEQAEAEKPQSLADEVKDIKEEEGDKN
jgi:DNA-binding response OmpR family regulator